MKIRSKWVDYYDYISRQGEDPNCVYVRAPLKTNRFYISGNTFLSHMHYTKRGYLSYIVAGLNIFPMIGKYEEPEVGLKIPLDRTPKMIWEMYFEEKEPKSRWSHNNVMIPNEAQIKKLIQAVGIPVFWIKGVDTQRDGFYIDVDEKIPILKDLGIPAQVPATQMWQNIYSVLTNILRKDPDKEPPCTISNEEKIWAAGFDTKTSFRNPINLRKLDEKRNRRK